MHNPDISPFRRFFVLALSALATLSSTSPALAAAADDLHIRRLVPVYSAPPFSQVVMRRLTSAALDRCTRYPEGRVPEADVGAVRDDYLLRHPDAQHWAGFGDFAFYRLEVRRAYYVGGFGSMGWIEAADLIPAMLEGACLANHLFDRYKSEKKQAPLKQIALWVKAREAKRLARLFTRGR